MQDKGGLQIGLTEGQGVSLPQFVSLLSSAQSTGSVESRKELVERDLDHYPSAYIKY
jgi:hypothetical protein